MLSTELFADILSKSSLPQLPHPILEMIMMRADKAGKRHLFQIREQGEQSRKRRKELRDQMVDQWLMNRIREYTFKGREGYMEFHSDYPRKDRPSYTLLKEAASRLPGYIFRLTFDEDKIQIHKDVSNIRRADPAFKTIYSFNLKWDTEPRKKKKKRRTKK
jgi:hypothetical protein